MRSKPMLLTGKRRGAVVYLRWDARDLEAWADQLQRIVHGEGVAVLR